MRAAAIGVSIGGVALGVATRRLRVARVVVRMLAGGTAATAVLLAAAGARSSRRAGASAAAPPAGGDGHHAGPPVRLRVLIPARDEVAVIDGVLADLAAQSTTDFEVVVIDDASSDGTGDAAGAAIRSSGLAGRGRVLRRVGGPGGKGAALADVEQLRGAAGAPAAARAVLVLDADARIDAGFVERCAEGLRGAPAITARRRMAVPRSAGAFGALLARLQDDEQTVDDLVQRGRLAIGGAGELRGNGMAIRSDELARLGGWPAEAVCEDLEVSTALFLATGRGAARPPGVEIVEQPVLEPRALLRQRLRWAEGSVRRDLRIALPALTAPGIPVRRRVDVAVAAVQDAMPWVGIGLLVGATLPGDGRRRAGAAATGIAIAYLGGGWLLAATASAREPGVHPRGPVRIGARAAASVAFEAQWPLVLLGGWLRVIRSPGKGAFARTPHRPWRDYLVGSAAASDRPTARHDPPRWRRSSATPAPTRFHHRGTTRNRGTQSGSTLFLKNVRPRTS
jgi:hypothetical protein